MTKNKTEIEMLFELLDETSLILKKELGVLYLEALASSGENLFQNDILQDLNDVTKKRLVNKYESVNLENFDREHIRKSMQLAILKGMKEATQPNHEMTPDAVSLFIGYLVNKLMETKKEFTLLDPAIGTANLVTAVLNQTDKNVLAYGMEVDDVLLHLAFVNANLQKHTIELFKQDTLQPGYVNSVDLTLCDLPVGYYPNDVIAADYELKGEEGKSFAHHLFIEKSIKQTKEGGFMLFLIPNFLFESDQAPSLNRFIKEHTVIQGLLQLPLSMFKKGNNAKSIFILQKKGEGVIPPKQALLAELPKFSNKEAMQGMIQRINSWISNEILHK